MILVILCYITTKLLVILRYVHKKSLPKVYPISKRGEAIESIIQGKPQTSGPVQKLWGAPKIEGSTNMAIWVCLKMVYIPNYSHLIGIMIINHWENGVHYFQTHPYGL